MEKILLKLFELLEVNQTEENLFLKMTLVVDQCHIFIFMTNRQKHGIYFQICLIWQFYRYIVRDCAYNKYICDKRYYTQACPTLLKLNYKT